MNAGLKYKGIAFFLLVLFSSSTLVGFACSVGINLGYNADHHPRREINDLSTANSNNKSNHHCNDSKKDGSQGSSESPSNKDKDCCSNQVKEFLQLDKNAQAGLMNYQLLTFVTTGSYFFNSEFVNLTEVNSQFQFVRRSAFLNDIEILLAIQSFRV